MKKKNTTNILTKIFKKKSHKKIKKKVTTKVVKKTKVKVSKKTLLIKKTKVTNKLSKKVKKAWAYFFKKQSVPAFFAVGMLNGLLPCGLVYTALAGALAGGSPLNSGLFMLFFGIGTSPALLTAGSLKTLFHKKLLQWKHVILSVSIGTMALLFILRGASLGIPYLSPEIDSDSVKPCCEHAAN